MKSYKFIVSSLVQGVYYRKNIQKSAQRENFNGYVKNLPNGKVVACVSCQKSDLENFVALLKKGSPSSIVENIQKQECDEHFKNGFEIRY